MTMYCEKCGESLTKIAIKAIAQDLGVRAYPSATECTDGKEHSFVSDDGKEEAE